MYAGYTVAQLRLIFKPSTKEKRIEGSALAYVQYFKPAPGSIKTNAETGSRFHATEDNLNMFEVVRSLRSNGDRKGEIIKLTDIWRSVQLIPKFGKACPEEWTCDTAVELANVFFVNCFLDKETYQSVY